MTENESLSLKERDIKERIEKIFFRTFTIGSCPEKVYQRFISFCEQNAKNVRYFQDENNKTKAKEEIIYHIGLRILLDIAETDAKFVMMFEKIKAVEDKIMINEIQNKQQTVQNKGPVKFGTKGEKDGQMG